MRKAFGFGFGRVFLMMPYVNKAIPVSGISGGFWVKRASVPNSEDFVKTAVINGEIFVS